MRCAFLILSIIFVMITRTITGCGPEVIPDDVGDEEIISLVLAYFPKNFWGDDEHIILVNPETLTCGSGSASEIFKKKGYDFDKLLKKLADINTESVMLGIESSPENGYIIDYENKFHNYINDEYHYTDWNRFYSENPEVGAYVSISIPAYDRNTGFVLVKLEFWLGNLSGAGFVNAYKYTSGKLELIDYVLIWVS
jgi:hypothetical protein